MGYFWIGLKFKFPLVWLLIESYQCHYQLNMYNETSSTTHLMTTQGYMQEDEYTTDIYDLTELHQQHAIILMKDNLQHPEEST